MLLFVRLFISDRPQKNVQMLNTLPLKPRNSNAPCEEHFLQYLFYTVWCFSTKCCLCIKIFYTSFLHTSFLIQTFSSNTIIKNLLHTFCTHFFLIKTFSMNTIFNTTDLTCVKALTKKVTPEVLLLRLYNREAN